MPRPPSRLATSREAGETSSQLATTTSQLAQASGLLVKMRILPAARHS